MMSELPERDDTAFQIDTVFQILGPLSVQVAGRRITVRAPRQRAVLAMLLLSCGQEVPRERLIEAVWPTGAPATGRTQVAICVTALRKLFRQAGCDDDVIVTAQRGYLVPSPPHRIDAVDFADRVADGRGAVRQGRIAVAIARFTEALALWRGPALPGLHGGPIERAVGRLEQERLAVHEELAALKLAVGQHETVAGELAVLVGQHPTRQTARAQLMLAQYRCGQRSDALATFAEGSRLAERDGTEPAAALRDLHDAILNDSIVVPVGASEAPEPVPAQLPADVPAFTGRACELSVLDHLVADDGTGPPQVGLVTGGPGVGKTGLAVHWAHRVAERFPQGQLFVDLHGHDEAAPLAPGVVLARFLRALGVPDHRIPAGVAERAALYRSVVHGRRMLVVLDNALSFAQVAPLIPGTGTCGVLVTSRGQLSELIDRHGAHRLRLRPLAMTAAVELLDRMVADARVAGDPAGTVVLAQLCDGLPLALRVVAARLVAKPHWTVDHLVRKLADPARRLDELCAGDQDVRARILTSYRELGPCAATLFRSLAMVDQGGFGVAVAAAAAGTGPDEAEGLLESLVDAHLVDVVGRDSSGGVRYRLDMLPFLLARERADAELSPGPAVPRRWHSDDLVG